MPFTIKQINEFVPKKDRSQFDADPAYNSVLGNIKLLDQELGTINNAYPPVKDLRRKLQNIIKAADGETSEELGDKEITNLSKSFNDFSEFALGSTNTAVKSTEQKNKIRNLMGYVAAGLGIEPESAKDFEVTADQLDDAKYVREQGRKDVEAEKISDPELYEVKVKEPARNAFEALEDLKAQARKLPKAGRDPARMEAQKKLAADLCKDIMASRRAISAKRNNKEWLRNATLDPYKKHNFMSDLENSETFRNFLKETPYSELAKLAGEGHGGALEDKFKDYVNNLDKLPTDVDPYYYPDAKKRTETIQDKLKARDLTPQQKEDLYVELLAARAAVDSVRGDKTTLSKQISPKEFEKIRQSYQKEPIKTVFKNAIGRQQGEKALTAAKDGHGGAFEDLMAEEARELAKTSAEDFSLRGLPKRLMPTREERMKDIQEMLLSGRLNTLQKYEHILEYDALANSKGHGPKEKIDGADLPAMKKAASEKAQIYRRVDDPKFLRRLENACLKGGNALRDEIGAAEHAHRGDLKAAKMQQDLALKADSAKSKEELAELAAQKMAIGRIMYKERDQNDLLKKDYDQLHDAGQGLLFRGLDLLNAPALMKNGTFKAMIDSMSEEELKAGIKSNGYDLARRFGDTQEMIKQQKDKNIQPVIGAEKVEKVEGNIKIENEDLKGSGIVPM